MANIDPKVRNVRNRALDVYLNDSNNRKLQIDALGFSITLGQFSISLFYPNKWVLLDQVGFVKNLYFRRLSSL